LIYLKENYFTNDTMTIRTYTAFTTAGTVFVWMRSKDWWVTHV